MAPASYCIIFSPSIQVGTFGYMFDVPLMITAVLVFGGQFGARTVVAALFTPGFMNILTRLVYSDAAFTADGINLDPALLLGGSLNLSNDLLLTCIIGAVVIGVGQGMVVRTQATTGGTDIIAMLLQKYAGIKFSTGIFLADCVVILSGLVVIGFGLGTGDSSGSGWVLTLYSLITIFICSRVVARVIDGASYDKLLFIISDENEKTPDIHSGGSGTQRYFYQGTGYVLRGGKGYDFPGGRSQGGACGTA